MTDPVYIAYYSADHAMHYWQEALEAKLPEIKLVDPESAEAQQAEVFMTWNPPGRHDCRT